VGGLPEMEKCGQGYILVTAESDHYLLHIANQLINCNQPDTHEGIIACHFMLNLNIH